MSEVLSIRVAPGNRDHHLWLNNGTWWVHYTVLDHGMWQRRVRRSLRTHDQSTARRRRDELLRDLGWSGSESPKPSCGFVT